jgi:hypothetical protein
MGLHKTWAELDNIFRGEGEIKITKEFPKEILEEPLSS